jgi:hypothetical protein
VVDLLAKRYQGVLVDRLGLRQRAVRYLGEFVLAEQKDRMGLFIRTIGIARATTKIGIQALHLPAQDRQRRATRSGLSSAACTWRFRFHSEWESSDQINTDV